MIGDDFNVLTITHPDVENGIGCRVTIWASGCPHHCPGCHNKHTWGYGQGKKISELWKEISEAVNKPYIDGITLSGGDPLGQNYSALLQLESFVRIFITAFPNKTIWIYSGEVLDELIMKSDMSSRLKLDILKMCDVMVDGPFVQKLHDPNLEFRGSSNQKIIDLQKYFKENFS